MSDAVVSCELRGWTEADSVADLTLLLHRAYAPLARMGLHYMATHQDPSVTLDRIRKGTCLVIEESGTLVGTMTYYAPHQAVGSPWLDREDTAQVAQLAVEPAYQRRGLGFQLMKEGQRRAAADGATELVIDTAEGAFHLIEWYERMGFRFIEYVDWDVTNYRSVVMSKQLSNSI